MPSASLASGPRPARLRRLVLALPCAAAILLAGCATGAGSSASRSSISTPSTMHLDPIQQQLLGQWVSLAPELRPSATLNPDGTLKPFYLSRDFRYAAGDRFALTIQNYADPYGKVPVARIHLAGHMKWQGAHPIAEGAQKVDFIADEAYEVTPLVQPFADLLNQVASAGYAPWQVGQAQSVFGKAFAPFGLVAGRPFMEHDLVYLRDGLLFWGARHIDGRGFDTEANRPTNLQIPLVRR